jgi:hypothetical protein
MLDEVRKSKEFVMENTAYSLADLDGMDIGVFLRLIDETIQKLSRKNGN